MKKYGGEILVAIVSLAIALVWFPPFDPFFDDKEIFKYTGFLISRGKIPYVDFFDHKPPLIFFFNYVGQALGSYGLWTLDALLVAGASVIFYKTCRKFGLPLPWLVPLLFNVLLRHPYYSFGFNLTREYSSVFILLAFCQLMSDNKWKYFFAGIFISISFFFQQEMVVLAVPITLFVIFKKWSSLLKNIVQLAVGAMIPAAMLIVYFAYHHALNAFIHSAFLFNSGFYTTTSKPSFVAEISTIIQYLNGYRLSPFVVIMIAAWALAHFKKPHQWKWLLVGMTTFSLSFVSEFLTGNLATGQAVTPYYFTAMSVGACVLIFCISKVLFENKSSSISVNIFYFMIFLLPFATFVKGRITNTHYFENGVAASPEKKLLNQYQPKENELYIFNHSNYTYLYNRYQSIIPNKWIYHYFWHWYSNWDADDKELKTIIASLQHTRFIIFDEKRNNFINKAHETLWKNFLLTNFEKQEGSILWIRK